MEQQKKTQDFHTAGVSGSAGQRDFNLMTAFQQATKVPPEASGQERQAQQKNARLLTQVENHDKRMEENGGIAYQGDALRRSLSEMTRKMERHKLEESDFIGYDMTFKVVEYKVPHHNVREVRRMEFNGIVKSRSEKFSPIYKSLLQKDLNGKCEPVPADQYNMESHNLTKALAENKLFSRYMDGFAERAGQLGVKPAELSQLRDDDVMDILLDAINKKEGGVADNGSVRSVKIKDGTRSEFMKFLGNEYGDAMEKAFLQSGVSERNSVLFVEGLKRGEVPAGFNVHHKHPIGGSDGRGYPDVNTFENLALMRVIPCHDMIHSFLDHSEQLPALHSQDGQAKSKWINIPMPKDGVMFYANPNRESQVHVDRDAKEGSQTNDYGRTIRPLSKRVIRKYMSKLQNNGRF